jgi:hypothetical protein
MIERINRIVELWENKGAKIFNGWNPYEVKQINRFTQIKNFILVELDTIYHDFAWGIGDVGEYERIKYVAFPRELFDYTDEQVKLWFKEQPIRNEKKTRTTDDLFSKISYKKELELLENPEKIQERIQKIKKELGKIKKRKEELKILNEKLEPLSFTREDYSFIQVLEKDGSQMIKL